MALPAQLQNRLSLPVVCSPLFIISNPDLVIAQCKAGVVGSFPARARCEAPRPPVGAIRGQPDRAQVQRPARA